MESHKNGSMAGNTIIKEEKPKTRNTYSKPDNTIKKEKTDTTKQPNTSSKKQDNSNTNNISAEKSKVISNIDNKEAVKINLEKKNIKTNNNPNTDSKQEESFNNKIIGNNNLNQSSSAISGTNSLPKQKKDSTNLTQINTPLPNEIQKQLSQRNGNTNNVSVNSKKSTDISSKVTSKANEDMQHKSHQSFMNLYQKSEQNLKNFYKENITTEKTLLNGVSKKNIPNDTEDLRASHISTINCTNVENINQQSSDTDLNMTNDAKLRKTSKNIKKQDEIKEKNSIINNKLDNKPPQNKDSSIEESSASKPKKQQELDNTIATSISNNKISEKELNEKKEIKQATSAKPGQSALNNSKTSLAINDKEKTKVTPINQGVKEQTSKPKNMFGILQKEEVHYEVKEEQLIPENAANSLYKGGNALGRLTDFMKDALIIKEADIEEKIVSQTREEIVTVEAELTPLPDIDRKKLHENTVMKHQYQKAERAAVTMRRMEYALGKTKKVKKISIKKMKEQIKIAKIIRLQRFWRQGRPFLRDRIVLIQKAFKGFYYRRKLLPEILERLQQEEDIRLLFIKIRTFADKKNNEIENNKFFILNTKFKKWNRQIQAMKRKEILDIKLKRLIKLKEELIIKRKADLKKRFEDLFINIPLLLEQEKENRKKCLIAGFEIIKHAFDFTRINQAFSLLLEFFKNNNNQSITVRNTIIENNNDDVNNRPNESLNPDTRDVVDSDQVNNHENYNKITIEKDENDVICNTIHTTQHLKDTEEQDMNDEYEEAEEELENSESDEVNSQQEDNFKDMTEGYLPSNREICSVKENHADASKNVRDNNHKDEKNIINNNETRNSDLGKINPDNIDNSIIINLEEGKDNLTNGNEELVINSSADDNFKKVNTSLLKDNQEIVEKNHEIVHRNERSSEHIDSIESIETIDPKNSIESKETIAPKNAVDFKETIKPTEPIGSIEALEATEPIDSIKPINIITIHNSVEVLSPRETIKSTEPVDSTEAIRPTDIIKRMKNLHHSEIIDLSEPIETVKPIEAIEPLKPIEKVKSLKLFDEHINDGLKSHESIDMNKNIINDIHSNYIDNQENDEKNNMNSDKDCPNFKLITEQKESGDINNIENAIEIKIVETQINENEIDNNLGINAVENKLIIKNINSNSQAGTNDNIGLKFPTEKGLESLKDESENINSHPNINIKFETCNITDDIHHKTYNETENKLSDIKQINDEDICTKEDIKLEYKELETETLLTNINNKNITFEEPNDPADNKELKKIEDAVDDIIMEKETNLVFEEVKKQIPEMSENHQDERQINNNKSFNKNEIDENFETFNNNIHTNVNNNDLVIITRNTNEIPNNNNQEEASKDELIIIRHDILLIEGEVEARKPIIIEEPTIIPPMREELQIKVAIVEETKEVLDKQVQDNIMNDKIDDTIDFNYTKDDKGLIINNDGNENAIFGNDNNGKKKHAKYQSYLTDDMMIETEREEISNNVRKNEKNSLPKKKRTEYCSNCMCICAIL